MRNKADTGKDFVFVYLKCLLQLGRHGCSEGYIFCEVVRIGFQ